MKNDTVFSRKGEGEPLVLLHGLGGDSNQWKSLLTANLPMQNIIPDMPGHGKNEAIPKQGCSFQSFAEEVKNKLDKNYPAPQYTLAGISMGAGIALQMAFLYPEIIKQIVLIRPAWLTEGLPDNLNLLYRLGIQWRLDNNTIHEWLLKDNGYLKMKKECKACAKSVEGQLSRPYPHLAAQSLVEMTSDSPLHSIAEIQAIQVPALVIGTEEDPLHPLYMATQLAEWLPNATFAEIPSRYKDGENHKKELNLLLEKYLVEKQEIHSD